MVGAKHHYFIIILIAPFYETLLREKAQQSEQVSLRGM
jgi:hypothetical protein